MRDSLKAGPDYVKLVQSA